MNEFRQSCSIDPKPISHFITPVTDDTLTKSLYNGNGKHGNVFVSASGNTVTVCESCSYGQPVPISFRAGDSREAVVVDVDVCSFENGKYGIAVAVNEPRSTTHDADEPEEGDGFTTKKEKAAREERAAARHSNSVLLYVLDPTTRLFRSVRTITVFGEITCMRVVVNPVDMHSQRDAFSAKIGAWPNIVAIGCERSTCYLGQFAHFDHEIASHWSEGITIAATTDALKAFHRDDRFQYYCGDQNNHSFKKDAESVSAVGYIPCFGLVVVGLTNGRMVLVPLDGKSTLTCLTVQYTTCINFIAVLEPEYDPAGGFFIFSARERPRDMQRAALPIFTHKIERSKDGDAYVYSDMSHVIIPMMDGRRWLNVHAVVKRRRRREADTGNETASDSSQLPLGLNTTQHVNHDGMERTMLFYSYLTLKGEMRGGLFDLNAFYSKRMAIGQVRFDANGQSPICSQFNLDIPQSATGEALLRARDLAWVSCDAVTRYVSPTFDRDPLFTPMAAQLRLVLCTQGDRAYAATVDSLQLRVLDYMGAHLGASLAQPDAPLALLEYTGLLLAPTTRKERARLEDRPVNQKVPSELDSIMRALVSERTVRSQIIKFIEERADRVQRLHIGRWMFNELRDTVARMDDAIAPLFDSVAPDSLSQETERLLEFCPQLFKFAELLFWKIRSRGYDMNDDTPKLRITRALHARAAFDLRLFLACAWWFTQKLPLCEGWTRALMREMADMDGKRREQGERQRHPLFLDALLRRLHGRTMEDVLWRGEERPAEWYPPALFNLVSLLRLGDAPLDDRTALIFYFLMDIDETVRMDRERPAEERREYPIKTSLLTQFLNSEAGELVDGKMSAGVKERWESDRRGRQITNGSSLAKTGVVSRLSDEEKAELAALLRTANSFRRLQKVDEIRMKELFSKQDYGIYRFNVFLIKKSRYPEVEDLPVPRPGEPAPHPIVAEYAKYREIALKQKAELPPATNSNAFACPYVVTKAKAPSSPGDVSANASRLFRSGNVTLVRGKTPRKLNIFKRASTAAGAAGPSQQSLLQTPPSARGAAGDDGAADAAETARVNALMRTPSMRARNVNGWIDEEDEEDRENGVMGGGEVGGANDSDVAPDEMARVREALRTPRSRATLATRGTNGGGADAGAGTPEGAMPPPTTAPMSILKSARRAEGAPPSTARSKLRFAEIFDEKSISPRERDTTASTVERMNQPNFDDSFDDDMEKVKSMISHGDVSAGDVSTVTTRLEREMREFGEEEVREEEEEEEEGEEEEVTDPMEEEVREEDMEEEEGGEQMSMDAGDVVGGGLDAAAYSGDEQQSEEGGAGGETFRVYEDHSSGGVTSPSLSMEGAADAAFFEEEEGEDAAAAAAHAATKTPPPTPDEEEEEGQEEQQVVATNDATKTPPPTPEEEEEEEPAAAAAPVGGAAEESGEEDAETPSLEERTMEEDEGRAVTPIAVPSEEFEPTPAAAATGVAAGAADPVVVVAVGEEEEEAELHHVQQEQQPLEKDDEEEKMDDVEHPEEEEKEEEESAAAAADEAAVDTTYVVYNATFAVQVRPDAAAAAAPAADAAVVSEEEPTEQRKHAPTPIVEEEEEEEVREAEEQAAASAAEEEEVEEEAAAAPAVPDMEEEEDEPNLSRGVTPDDDEAEEKKEEGKDGEKEKEEEGEKEGEENGEEEQEAPEQEEDADEIDVIGMEEEEKEEEEVEQAAPAVPAAAAAEPEEDEEEEAEPAARAALPVPKPRTVYDGKQLPMSLGLKSFVFRDTDGIEKSFEEQRGSSDEEEEEEDASADILTRRRRSSRTCSTSSSSKLQHKKEEEEKAAAAAAATASAARSTRKRSASRGRKESEKDAAGPSTSSPRQKREKVDGEKEEEEEEGHLFTTTRTRVVEERYVEREDGVMQHTVKQSTKVIETADGVVVKEEKEDTETIEEEGDREINDEADRVTPPVLLAHSPTEVKRTSSRVVASRSRIASTGSRLSTRSSPSRKKKGVEAEEGEGEDKEKEKERKKREEKATTPLRSPAKRTPSRRKLMNDEEEEEKKVPEPLTPRRSTRVRKASESVSQESLATTSTPSKSVRKTPTRAARTPSREPSAVPASPSKRRGVVLQLVDEEEKKEEGEDTVVKTPGKRGRPRKNPADEPVAAAAATASAAAPMVVPARRGRPSAAASAAAAATTPAARKRSASESVGKKKRVDEDEEEEEEEEEEVDAIALLRKRREESKKELAAQLAREQSTSKAVKARRAQLSAIPEGKVVSKASEKKKEEEEEEGDEQPSTSKTAPRSAARRKRTQSEATGSGVKEEEMKTPTKKRTKAGKEDEEEEIGAGDQSILRRSTRRAAAPVPDEVAKTPSKSARRKL